MKDVLPVIKPRPPKNFLILVLVAIVFLGTVILFLSKVNPGVNRYAQNIKENIEFEIGLDKYQGIPILLYHHIKDEDSDNDLMMPKERFREQMQYLKDNKYTTLTLDELYTYLKGHIQLPKKSVVITFDDGYKDNYTNAYPILKEFGFKATIFVITNRIDKHPECLTSKQIIELENNNISIQSHTVDHKKLDILSYEQQLATLKDSKAYLEKLLNNEVKFIAYPYAIYNDDTLKVVKAAGYKAAFIGSQEFVEKSKGIYELPRIYIGKDCRLRWFKKILHGYALK